MKVNKINPAIVTSTDQRFVVSKNEGGERASIFPGLNSNDHVILVDQLMGGDNFCGNGCHWCFLGLDTEATTVLIGRKEFSHG